MEWFLVLVAAGGAGFAIRSWRARRQAGRARTEELEVVRRLAAEDVDHLGELVDAVVGDLDLDDETREARRVAAESYEAAHERVSHITSAGEIKAITETIATGRNALASVQARQGGRPAPEPRVMCFFDPQHGPSTTDVLWARPGHGERRVPACAQDAQRVADRLAPEIRTVSTGSRTMPYWTAGYAFLPYTRGYFAGVATLSWAHQPSVPDAAAGTGTPGSFGSGIVGSSGRFDGGGFDGSGAV
jgi:hypothetical protein